MSSRRVLNSVPYQRDKTGILTSVQCPQLATHISHFSSHSQTSGKHSLCRLSLTHLPNSSTPFSLLHSHPNHRPIGAFYRITSRYQIQWHVPVLIFFNVFNLLYLFCHCSVPTSLFSIPGFYGTP